MTVKDKLVNLYFLKVSYKFQMFEIGYMNIGKYYIYFIK